jgi:Protein of unknown function (DUF5818)
MKKVSLLFAMLLAFAVFAYAQSSDTQSGSSSSSSSPSASQGSSSSQGSSTTAPDTSTSTSGSSTSSQGTSTSSQGSSTGSQGSGTYSSGSQGSSTTGGMEAGGKMKGEKGEKTGKFKGCIRSEGGKFTLEDAHGHTYNLNSSEDLSAHVGHEVLVHGSEAGAGGSSAASTSAGGATKEITVTKVDHISDTCKLGKHSKSEKGSSMKSPQSQQ